MQKRVDNSYFEKNERYIVGMYTQYPELAPQYYSFVEKTPAGTMRSSHFTFDGQVFSRDKKNGGNVQSSYCISGKGYTRKEVKELQTYEEFKEFFRGFFNLVEADVPQPLIISSKDLASLKNGFLK